MFMDSLAEGDGFFYDESARIFTNVVDDGGLGSDLRCFEPLKSTE